MDFYKFTASSIFNWKPLFDTMFFCATKIENNDVWNKKSHLNVKFLGIVKFFFSNSGYLKFNCYGMKSLRNYFEITRS
jgi:hypothetical protein